MPASVHSCCVQHHVLSSCAAPSRACFLVACSCLMWEFLMHFLPFCAYLVPALFFHSGLVLPNLLPSHSGVLRKLLASSVVNAAVRCTLLHLLHSTPCACFNAPNHSSTSDPSFFSGSRGRVRWHTCVSAANFAAYVLPAFRFIFHIHKVSVISHFGSRSMLYQPYLPKELHSGSYVPAIPEAFVNTFCQSTSLHTHCWLYDRLASHHRRNNTHHISSTHLYISV